MGDCIATNGLTKHFGDVHAVEGVSLHVERGEIYGFLGLNGAGKTTTIRMLLGMVRPTAGKAFLFGREVESRAIDLWRRVGYLVETPAAYPELTVRENLEIVRRLRLIEDHKSVDAVMERLGLSRYRDRPARHLSLGNAQRLGLAKALIHDPELLILDEPANGLDPAGIVEIRRLLRRLAAERGVTVFISSHILSEISKFSDRIGIIHEGSLLQEVDSDRLAELMQRRLIVRTRDNARAAGLLRQSGHAVTLPAEGDSLSVTNVQALERPDDIATLLVKAGCAPLELSLQEEELESHFLRVIGATEGGR